MERQNIRINAFTRILAALSVLFAVQQLVIIGLSLAQVVITQAMALGSLALGTLLAAGMWLLLRPAQPETGPEPKNWHKWVFGSLSGMLGVVFLLLWYVSYLTPDLTCDGTAYHIPAISMWAQHGFIYWIDPMFQLETLVNGYPKAVELIGFVVIRATGLSEFANTLNLLFLPLGILGMASLARSLGASKPLALFIGCLWILIPVNLFQATTAYIDSAYGSLAIGFIALLVALQQNLRADTSIWRLVPALGAAAGLALAAKGSAGLLAVAGFGALILAVVITRLLTRQNGKGLLGRGLLVAVCAGAIALSVGGFWYARNYVVTGTPLYPVGVKLNGKVIFPGLSTSEALWEVGNTPEFMKPWGWKERIAYTWTETLIYSQSGVAKWPVSMMGVDSRTGGLGLLWLVVCIPAIVYALVSSLVLAKKRPQRLSLWLVLIVVAGAFIGSPMNWWARYTVWLYALGLPAFAIALSDLLSARRWWLAPVGLWALFGLGLGFNEGRLALQETLRQAYPGPWPIKQVSGWAPAAWMWQDGYLFPPTRGTAFDKVMASDGPIAVGPLWGYAPPGRLQHNLIGQLAEPIGKRQLLFLPDKMTLDVYRKLKENHIVYIIWDGNQELPAFIKNYAAEVEHVPGFWVVTVKPLE